MRNFSDRVMEKIKTHFIFNNFVFVNHAIYEIKSKNAVDPDRPQTIICMRIECWIPKAINTYSNYVILITFFTA